MVRIINCTVYFVYFSPSLLIDMVLQVSTIALVALCVAYASCYPTGAPAPACSALAPIHVNTTAQSSASPWTIKFGASQWSPNGVMSGKYEDVQWWMHISGCHWNVYFFVQKYLWCWLERINQTGQILCQSKGEMVTCQEYHSQVFIETLVWSLLHGQSLLHNWEMGRHLTFWVVMWFAMYILQIMVCDFKYFVTLYTNYEITNYHKPQPIIFTILGFYMFYVSAFLTLS